MKSGKAFDTALSLLALLVALVYLFLVLASCEQKEPKPPNILGCQSGTDPKTGVVVMYRCATYADYLAGSNVANGGTASFAYYKNNKWENCQRCQ